MSKKVKISRIVLEIGDKKIELDVTEARKLQRLLNKTLGQHTHNFCPVYVERRPYYSPYWTISSGDTRSSTIIYTLSSGDVDLTPILS